MGDLRSAVYDDIEEYQALCERYNEEPVCNEYGINPYCKHRDDLKKKWKGETDEMYTY